MFEYTDHGTEGQKVGIFFKCLLLHFFDVVKGFFFWPGN